MKENKTMAKRKEILKYTFTVEGETEKWHFDWLANCINHTEESKCNVSIFAKVQQNPMKFAKNVNPISTPSATHICDMESNDECHVTKFNGILNQLSEANKLKGRTFKYDLGYSNFTFELWMILHKAACNGSLANRTQYLASINRAFNERFEDLDKYKQEVNFKRCLSKLSLDDVKSAINRANKIMDDNSEKELKQKEYKGFTYYSDNPSLTIHKAIEKILKECKLI